MSGQGFNEGAGKPFTPADVRYTQSKDGLSLYVISMGVPENALQLVHLGESEMGRSVKSVSLLGSDETVRWKQEQDRFVIHPVKDASATQVALVFKLNLDSE